MILRPDCVSMAQRPRGRVATLVLVLLLLGAGVAGGQSTQPAWADGFFVELRGWTDDYNAYVERSDPSFPGHTLLRGERVDLYVRDDDGAVAVFSFRTDERLRIDDLRQGARADATARVTASRAVLERLATAEDPAPALRNAILAGEIDIRRVVTVLGQSIAVGVLEAAAAVLGAVAGVIIVAKVGVGGLVTGGKTTVTTLSGTGRRILETTHVPVTHGKEFLYDVLTAVSALDLFGVIDVRKAMRRLYRRLTAPFVRLRRRLVGASTEEQAVTGLDAPAPATDDSPADGSNSGRGPA